MADKLWTTHTLKMKWPSRKTECLTPINHKRHGIAVFCMLHEEQEAKSCRVQNKNLNLNYYIETQRFKMVELLLKQHLKPHQFECSWLLEYTFLTTKCQNLSNSFGHIIHKTLNIFEIDLTEPCKYHSHIYLRDRGWQRVERNILKHT